MRLFWVIRDTIRGFNRVIINGSPRLLTLNSLAWIFIGTSCGMIGLVGRINASFVFALICFGWAAVEIVLALLRSNSWKKAGLILSLPDGTVFVRVEHVFRESSVSRSVPQIVPFILRAVGDKHGARAGAGIMSTSGDHGSTDRTRRAYRTLIFFPRAIAFEDEEVSA